jgi:hypothetical protein
MKTENSNQKSKENLWGIESIRFKPELNSGLNCMQTGGTLSLDDVADRFFYNVNIDDAINKLEPLNDFFS